MMKHQRGYAAWVVMALLVAALIGAWQFSTRKSQQKVAAAAASEQAARNAQRRALEERLAMEKAQTDSVKAALQKVDAVIVQWDDAVKVAGSASRVSLAGPVANLQAIRRQAGEITVPPCFDAARQSLLSHMDQTVTGFLEFMRNEHGIGDRLAAITLGGAAEHRKAFEEHRNNCPI